MKKTKDGTIKLSRRELRKIARVRKKNLDKIRKAFENIKNAPFNTTIHYTDQEDDLK